MTIIPAIDLLNGTCVRLLKGNYDKSTVYSSDPAVPSRVVQLGMSRFTIVDLDAARGNGKKQQGSQ